MKVEIRYNPAKVSTRVVINGVENKEDDVYDLIFPVKNYPMQSWLYKNGSWTGIAKNFSDIARGDDLLMVFTGRTIDYEDFRTAIYSYNWFQKVDIIHEEQEVDYSNILKQLKVAVEHMMKIDFDSCTSWDLIKKCKAIKEELQPEKKFINEIHSFHEMMAASPETGNIYVIYDSAITAFNDFDKLIGLSSSMLLPPDSIVCIFKDAERMEDFKSYANVMNSGIRFSLNKDMIKALYKKYSEPAEAQYFYDSMMKLYSYIKKLSSEKEIDDRIRELNWDFNAYSDDILEQKRDELIRRKKWLKNNRQSISLFTETMGKVEGTL